MLHHAVQYKLVLPRGRYLGRIRRLSVRWILIRNTKQLHSGIFNRKPDVILTYEIEYDEVYVVAGHTGQPDAVKTSLGVTWPIFWRKIIRMMIVTKVSR